VRGKALEDFFVNDVCVTLTDIKMAGNGRLKLLDQIKTIDTDAL
jgi:hypothetical protein